MSLSRKRPNPVLPCVEVLEDRTVMSTASFDPGTGLLQITGTNLADHIKIVDNGSPTAAGAIKVFDNGHLLFSSPAVGGGVSAVTHIEVDTLQGNDSVTYKLTGPLLFAQRTVDVDLGEGADTFKANLNGSFGFGASLAFNVLGQQGNDHLSATWKGELGGPFFNVPASSLDFNFDGGDDRDVLAVALLGKVDTGAHLGVNLHGGAQNDVLSINATKVNVAQGATLDLEARGQEGNDRVGISYFGQVLGALKVQEGGGPDNDHQVAKLTLAAGSNGSVDAKVNGGPGDDNQTLLVRKQVATDPVTISAVADGGPGLDTLHKTANVTDLNCEVVIIVP
jgi:hypothetical protein